MPSHMRDWTSPAKPVDLRSTPSRAAREISRRRNSRLLAACVIDAPRGDATAAMSDLHVSPDINRVVNGTPRCSALLQNDSRSRPDYYRAAIPLLESFERQELLALVGCRDADLRATVRHCRQRGADFVSGFLTTATSNVFSSVYHVNQPEVLPTDIRATVVCRNYSVPSLSSGALPFILHPVRDHLGAAAMFVVEMLVLAIALSTTALGVPQNQHGEASTNSTSAGKTRR